MGKKIDAELTPEEQIAAEKLRKTWADARSLQVGAQVVFTGVDSLVGRFGGHPLKGVEGILVKITRMNKTGYDCTVAVPRPAWEAAMECSAEEYGIAAGQFAMHEANLLEEIRAV